MTVQETALDMHVGVWEFLAEAWVDSGLLQGQGALSVAVHAWDLLKEVTIFMTSTIVWPEINNREGRQLHPSKQDPVSPSVSLSHQGDSISLLSSPSEGRQSENHNHRKLIKLITWTTAFSNSMKLLAMPRRATQDRRVLVESSDKTWSTGEGNGKPLQYSCLEKPMNSMKRQKDMAHELPRSVGAHCATDESGEITPERMKRRSQRENSAQLWI